MMRNLLFVTLVACCFTSFGKDKKPKVDIVDDTVTVDGKAAFILYPVKKAKNEGKDLYIKDLSGKKLALIQSDCYDDPAKPNPDRYKYPSSGAYLLSCFNIITFLADKKTADFSFYYKQSRLAEFLVESELIKDGTITGDAEDEFILIHGNKNVEEKAQKLGSGNTIIINNNSSTPAPRNGININIGTGE